MKNIELLSLLERMRFLEPLEHGIVEILRMKL